MSEFAGLYGVWWREYKVFTRETSRVVAAIATPLMWLLLFGYGIGAQFGGTGEVAYQAFIFPGVMVMATLFSTIFFGLYIVWDRRLDVLKEVLASPVRRSTIFFGKVLGGSTEAVINSFILIVLGFLLVGVAPAGALPALGVLFLVAVSTASIGLALGTLFESPEGFQVIISFLVLPLMFLSGAFYAITPDTHPALAFAVRVNPLSYGVDALRGLLIGQHEFPLLADVGIMGAFALAMVGLGTFAFRRMK